MTLVDAFLAQLREPGRVSDPSRVLLGMWTAGREQWPELAVSEAAYAGCLGARVAGEADPVAALGGLRGADLYLVCGCLAGDPRAFRALEAGPLQRVRGKLQRTGLPAEAVADACQRIAQHLLVAGPDGTPRLASYAGRGDLAGWLYVAVAREARRLAQRDARHVPASGPDLMDETIGADPELAHLKGTYREAFRGCFHAAVAELGERERNLLRQHLLDGLGIDQLASLHKIHRATAARWLTRVREELARRTRALLAAQLGLGERESDSVLRLIRSQLDLSLTRALGGREGV